MSVSKTGVVLFTVLFYTVLSLMMGFAGETITGMSTYSPNEESALVPSTSNTGDFDFGSGAGKKANFLNNIVVSYSNLPIWINVLIFTPLGIVFTWIIVTTFIPTVNGGN